MSDIRSATTREKPFTVAVLRIGSHPLVFSVLAVLVIGALVFFLAIVPLVRMLQTGGKASLADAEERNRSAQSKLDTDKKLANAASSLTSEDRNMLAYALPFEVDAPGLVVMMKSLAIASGVKMSTFDVAEPPAESGESAGAVGRAVITTSIDLVTYDRLKIFLTNTEASLRLFDIKSMSFSPASGSANLQLITYYLNKI
jgi:Tfp pilus assembly protein PilO